MQDNESAEHLKERLLESIAQCERLRRENAHLKKLLSGFSLKPASDLAADKDSKVEEPSEDRSEASPKFNLDERLKIYRDLFRGREDVYAVRWESKKGKSGYSRGLCDTCGRGQ